MATRDSTLFAAGRRAERALVVFGDEVRHSRMGLGLRQIDVARSVRVSQAAISRIEAGRLRTLSLMTAFRIAAAVGLDLSIKEYPSARRPRDIGQLKRLKEFLAHAALPLRWGLEVPLKSLLPYPDQRAWDALLEGNGEETGIELEVKLYDIQAQTRRIRLKQRDGRVTYVLIVVADTRSNRRILDEAAGLLHDFPVLGKAEVIAALREGRHPGTGIVLF